MGSSVSQTLGGYPLVLGAVEGTLSPPIGHLLALWEQLLGAFVAPTQQRPIIFRQVPIGTHQSLCDTAILRQMLTNNLYRWHIACENYPRFEEISRNRNPTPTDYR